jgi:hypothetical protein
LSSFFLWFFFLIPPFNIGLVMSFFFQFYPSIFSWFWIGLQILFQFTFYEVIVISITSWHLVCVQFYECFFLSCNKVKKYFLKK